MAGCIPIIISNSTFLLYTNRLNYSSFTINISEHHFTVFNHSLLFKLSYQINKYNLNITNMLKILLNIKEKFYYNGEFQLQSLTDDNNINSILKD